MGATRPVQPPERVAQELDATGQLMRIGHQLGRRLIDRAAEIARAEGRGVGTAMALAGDGSTAFGVEGMQVPLRHAQVHPFARLQAEVEGRAPVYPAATDPVIADQIRIEQALHASRMADLSGMLSAAQARVTQSERAVAEAQSMYEARVSARSSLGSVRSSQGSPTPPPGRRTVLSGIPCSLG